MPELVESSKTVHSKRGLRDFPGGRWLRLGAPIAGGLGSIPGQGIDPTCTTKAPTCHKRPGQSNK